MENRARLRAKTPIPDTQNSSHKKRGFGGRVFRGGKGGASGAGVLGQLPYRICVRVSSGLYGDRKSREGQRCIESTVR